jgi:hypothetical protein
MPLTKKHHFTRNSRLETSQETRLGGAPFPTRDEIARLAYAYWEERGKPLGSAEADWVRAEDELAGAPGSGPPARGNRAPSPGGAERVGNQ